MRIIFHGHSCIQISDGEHSLIIDPFLTGNPVAKTNPADVRVQYVLLTHAHADHVSDAESVARANNAAIVATFELATYFSWKGVSAMQMNIGGTIDLGFAKVKMVQAFHSSSMIIEDEQRIVYMGMPAGFLITWNGRTILHAGDTGLFGDMKLIGEQHNIDVACLPIGDTFTMGPDDAILAAQWLQAKSVIPIHHGTWEPISQDIQSFTAKLNAYGIKGIALAPGEAASL